MRRGVPLAAGIVADTPARFIVSWYAGQSAAPAAALEDAGAVVGDPAPDAAAPDAAAPDAAAPGAVAAGVAGPDPPHAASARTAIAAAASAVCRERIPASLRRSRHSGVTEVTPEWLSGIVRTT